MKKLIYSIFAIAAISMVSCGSPEGEETNEAGEGHEQEGPAAISGTYNSVEGSSITWKARKKASEDFVHVGSVPVSGNVIVDNNMIVGGEFTIDFLSIDEDGDTDYTKMLEAHLQDSTFFFTSKYPTGKFTITGSEGGNVTGKLEMLGTSVDVSIEGNGAFSEDEVTYEGTATVDMLPFNMPFLVMTEQAPEEEKGQTPNPNIIFDLNLSFKK